MNMTLGESQNILGSKFQVNFVENEGMAFGLTFAGEYGKLYLSIFRILAVIAIAYYLYKLVQRSAPKGLIISIALILAGALGNILDSAFYGIIFSDSENGQVAQLFPEEGGYAGFLYGKVVDMLYFPLSRGIYPDWFPFWGGESYEFFRPVFNIADSSITIGVFMIILFQRRYFTSESKVSTPEQTDGSSTQPEMGVSGEMSGQSPLATGGQAGNN